MKKQKIKISAAVIFNFILILFASYVSRDYDASLLKNAFGVAGAIFN